MEFETIKGLMRLSKITGMLEALGTLPGREMSKATTLLLEYAAEQLGEYIGDRIKEEEEVIPDDGKEKIGFAEIQPEGTPPHQ